MAASKSGPRNPHSTPQMMRAPFQSSLKKSQAISVHATEEMDPVLPSGLSEGEEEGFQGDIHTNLNRATTGGQHIRNILFIGFHDSSKWTLMNSLLSSILPGGPKEYTYSMREQGGLDTILRCFDLQQLQYGNKEPYMKSVKLWNCPIYPTWIPKKAELFKDMLSRVLRGTFREGTDMAKVMERLEKGKTVKDKTKVERRIFVVVFVHPATVNLDPELLSAVYGATRDTDPPVPIVAILTNPEEIPPSDQRMQRICQLCSDYLHIPQKNINVPRYYTKMVKERIGRGRTDAQVEKDMHKIWFQMIVPPADRESVYTPSGGRNHVLDDSHSTRSVEVLTTMRMKSKFKVLFVGRHGAGKTSLINSLLFFLNQNKYADYGGKPGKKKFFITTDLQSVLSKKIRCQLGETSVKLKEFSIDNKWENFRLLEEAIFCAATGKLKNGTDMEKWLQRHDHRGWNHGAYRDDKKVNTVVYVQSMVPKNVDERLLETVRKACCQAGVQVVVVVVSTDSSKYKADSSKVDFDTRSIQNYLQLNEKCISTPLLYTQNLIRDIHLRERLEEADKSMFHLWKLMMDVSTENCEPGAHPRRRVSKRDRRKETQSKDDLARHGFGTLGPIRKKQLCILAVDDRYLLVVAAQVEQLLKEHQLQLRCTKRLVLTKRAGKLVKDQFDRAGLVLLVGTGNQRMLIISKAEDSQLGEAYHTAVKEKRSLFLLLAGHQQSENLPDDRLYSRHLDDSSFISNQQEVRQLAEHKRFISTGWVADPQGTSFNPAQKQALIEWIREALQALEAEMR